MRAQLHISTSAVLVIVRARAAGAGLRGPPPLPVDAPGEEAGPDDVGALEEHVDTDGHELQAEVRDAVLEAEEEADLSVTTSKSLRRVRSRSSSQVSNHSFVARSFSEMKRKPRHPRETLFFIFKKRTGESRGESRVR